MPLHNSNLLPEGLLALREFKFMLLYATLCYLMLLSSRQHCPGTLFCDTTILVINKGNSIQLCSFGGQGHLGGLTANGTAGT